MGWLILAIVIYGMYRVQADANYIRSHRSSDINKQEDAASKLINNGYSDITGSIPVVDGVLMNRNYDPSDTSKIDQFII
ncbi:hypothetical protein [Photobacterium damselae]|uniref:Uncharacterized protein n=1 Tax=Photobacterium damselae subsp. damselae TaxID=85581 RepID=A0A7Y7UHD7_PHODD|nr:hypothetical protein [Photobacterium damselae]AWK84625.1 hypothetical protein BST98_21600 [Photobacterium damselae]MBE8127638.1 hypothetical protein [Photobacterium damselae subsp. piscicida]NVO61503.1 hypothetical protein [Photobacterium damselae subsp. damselae]NVP03435.1 hypothetical protein [Photobacterium damselae subsp. damselae]TLS84326.1 hypothetical protein FD720_17405 [Photobacterium damselae subsp. damselae]